MALSAKGMSAVCLAGSVEKPKQNFIASILEGRYQVVFINPELLIHQSEVERDVKKSYIPDQLGCLLSSCFKNGDVLESLVMLNRR